MLIVATALFERLVHMAHCPDPSDPRSPRLEVDALCRAGDLDGPATRALVEQHVAPLREAGVDVLVLGCTHFPLIRATIEEAAGA